MSDISATEAGAQVKSSSPVRPFCRHGNTVTEDAYMLQRIHITVEENIFGMENVCKICRSVFATICYFAG